MIPPRHPQDVECSSCGTAFSVGESVSIQGDDTAGDVTIDVPLKPPATNGGNGGKGGKGDSRVSGENDTATFDINVNPSPADSNDTLPAEFFSGAAPPSSPDGVSGSEFPQHNIPGYEILGVLGRGGMGVVYKARQFNLNRIVALKTVIGGAFARQEELARLRLEAEIIGRFQHTNIVQVFDVGESEGCLYFSLEYVDGGTLADRLDGAPLSAKDAALMMKALAEAMDYAHGEGIVHRDLKPTNILIASPRQSDAGAAEQASKQARSTSTSSAETLVPKVTDFGLAKLLESDDGHTRSGAFMGTPSYASPEQARGDTRHVGPAADIYALGAILYELLTGRPPFRGTTLMETLEQVMHQEPVAPTLLNPGLSRDLETICLKCLRKSPQERYASGQAMADDIGRYLAGEPILARPIGRVERLVKLCQRRPAVAALVASLVVVLVASSIISTAFGLQASEKAKLAAQKATQATAAEARERIAKNDAQKKATIAEAAKVAAVRAQGEERKAAQKAKEEKTKAEELAGKLKTALVQLQDELDKSQFLAYSAQFQLADSESRRGDANKAFATLATTDPTVQGWEADHLVRNLRRHIVDFAAHRGPVLAVSASPLGNRFATAGADGLVKLWSIDATQERPGFRQTVLVLPTWDTGSLKEVAQLKGHAGAVTCLAFSPDGARLCSGGADKVIRVWDVAKPRLVAEFRGHEAPVTCVAMTSIDEVVSGSEDKTARRWSVLSKQTIAAYQSHQAPIRSLAVAPPLNRLVTTDQEGKILVWNLTQPEPKLPDGPEPETPNSDTNEPLKPSSDEPSVPNNAAKTPEDDDTETHSPEVVRMQPLMALEGHGSGVVAVAMPVGTERLYTTGVDKQMRVWHLLSGAELASMPMSAAATWLAAGADSSWVVSPEGRYLRLWQPTGGASPILLGASTSLQVRSAATHPSMEVVLAGYQDGSVVLWDSSSSPGVRQIEPVAGAPIRAPKGVARTAFSHDGKLIAVVGVHDLATDIIDVETGRIVKHLSQDSHAYQAITAMAFSPDKKHLLFGGYSSTKSALVDWRTDKRVREYPSHGETVDHLTFSPDGSRFISTGRPSRAAIVRDVMTGVELHRLELPNVTSCQAFSPDASYIAAGCAFTDQGGIVRIWNGLNGKLLHSIVAHPREVSHLTFNPAGDRLLTCGYERDIREWDVATGKETRVFHGHATMPLQLNFSRDGRRLVSAGTDGTLRLWDYATGQQAAVLPSAGTCKSLEISPAGNCVAVSSFDANVQLFHTSEDESTHTFRPRAGLLRAAAWSPDGMQIAVGGENTQIYLWDIESDQVRQLKGHAYGLFTLDFHPDGKQLLSTSDARQAFLWDLPTGKSIRSLVGLKADEFFAGVWKPDGSQYLSWNESEIHFWDTGSGDLIRTIKDAYDPRETLMALEGVRMSRDNRWIAAWARVRRQRTGRPQVALIDAQTGKTKFVVPGGDLWHRGVAISPDSQYLAAIHNQRIVLTDIATGKKTRELEGFAEPSFAFSHDSKWVAGGGLGNTVRIWSVETGNLAHQFYGHSHAILNVAFRPDDAQLLSTSMDGTLRVWDVPRAQPEAVAVQDDGATDVAWKAAAMARKTGEVTPSPISPTARAFAISRDGKTWLVGAGNSVARYSETAEHRLVLPGPANEAPPSPNVIAFSDSHDAVAIGDSMGRVHWWDGEKSGVQRVLGQHQGLVSSVGLNASGTQVVSTGVDRFCKLWDARQEGNLIAAFEHPTVVFSAAVHPNGEHVVTGASDGQVRIWDVASGKIVRSIKADDYVSRVAYSPSGDRIVSIGMARRTISVRDSATGERVRELRGPRSGSPICIAFSQDGRRLASGDSTGAGFVWDIDSGDPLSVLRAPPAPMVVVQFRPDGVTLDTASLDRAFRTWRLDQ